MKCRDARCAKQFDFVKQFYREMVSLKGWGKEGKKLRSGVIAESDAPSVKKSSQNFLFYTCKKGQYILKNIP
jgi:hypothetical protein